MSEDIKIIVNDADINLANLPREEQESIMDRLRLATPDIPRAHFGLFLDLINATAAFETITNRPAIKELLIRRLIQLSAVLQSGINHMVIPVMPSGQFSGRNITGSAQGRPMFRRYSGPTHGPRAEMPGTVSVKFDHNVRAITEDGIDYVVPAGDEIYISGLALAKECPNGVSRHRGDGSAAWVSSGAWSAEELYNLCQYGPDIKPHMPHIGRHIFIGMTEAQQGAFIGAVFDFLVERLTRAQLDQDLMLAKISRWAAAEAFNVVPLAEEQPLNGAPPFGVNEIDELLTRMEPIHKIKFSAFHSTNITSDLAGFGLLRIHDGYSLGRPIDDLLSAYLSWQRRLSIQKEARAKALADNNLLNSYGVLIERKFGKKHLAAIETKLKAGRKTVAALLKLLEPAERKAVELEWERRRGYAESLRGNKCAHIAALRQVRRSIDVHKLRPAFAELSSFFAQTKPHTMITCATCGFEILCPHQRVLITADIEQTRPSELKGLLHEFMDSTRVRGQTFCKICGELIAADFGTYEESKNIMDEELKLTMWSEFASLMRYIKFGQLVNVGNIIAAMRDKLYPVIYEIEKQIVKSRTNTTDEIRAKRKLFMSIYGMAYLVHFVMSNGTSSESSLRVTFRGSRVGPRDKNAIVEYIKHALGVIISGRNVAIREIPGMTNEIVKTKLIEAFKLVSAEGAQVIDHKSPKEDALVALVLNPVYGYIYRINLSDELLGGKPLRGQHDYIDQIESYMGAPPDKLTGDHYWDNVRQPKFDGRWRLGDYESISPELEISAPEIVSLDWKKARLGYIAASFKFFADWLREEKGPIFDEGAGGVTQMTAEYIARQEKFQEFQRRENVILAAMSFSHAKNFWTYEHKEPMRQPLRRLPLGRIFDEEGRPHSWTVIKNEYGVVLKTPPVIYSVILDGEPKMLTVGEIASMTLGGKQFMGQVVDRKCGLCGILYSECESIDEDKIRTALDSRISVGNFFRFFEHRCPEGDIHTFEGNVCKKCGLSAAFLFGEPSAPALVYYKKYRVEFEAAEGRRDDIVFTEAVLPPAPTYNYTKWAPSFNRIVDLCAKVEANQKALTCLGSTERQPYADIESGAYIPPETENKTDMRIYRIRGYIAMVLTCYNTLRFYSRIEKPTPAQVAIGELVVEVPNPADLQKILPDIYDETHSRIDHFALEHKAREVVEFCIQYFAELCLKIYDEGPKESEKIRQAFVKMIVRRILKADEMVTKPGYFNWSMIYGDDMATKTESDQNTADDAQDDNDAADDKPEDVANDGPGDTNAPMAARELDVDNEDADPDDDTNQIRVGESLGLT